MYQINSAILKDLQLNRVNLCKHPPAPFASTKQAAMPIITESSLYVPEQAPLVPVPHKNAFDRVLKKMHIHPGLTNIGLVIMPASKRSRQFKLHVIDRRLGEHLGMCYITHHELRDLRTSKAFERYSLMFGSKFIDLKSSAVNTAVVTKLLRGASGDYIEAARNNCHLLEPSLKGSLLSESNMWLISLIDRINDNNKPNATDLNKFFYLAEKYKFKIYVRPELCWMQSPDTGDACEDTLPRFHLECFMLFDNYVGTLSMSSELLYEQLNQHPALLSQVHIIEDVCDIMPLPKMMVSTLRTFCKWLGLEILYDAFGEFIFDLYKQYV